MHNEHTLAHWQRIRSNPGVNHPTLYQVMQISITFSFFRAHDLHVDAYGRVFSPIIPPHISTSPLQCIIAVILPCESWLTWWSKLYAWITYLPPIPSWQLSLMTITKLGPRSSSSSFIDNPKTFIFGTNDWNTMHFIAHVEDNDIEKGENNNDHVYGQVRMKQWSKQCCSIKHDMMLLY